MHITFEENKEVICIFNLPIQLTEMGIRSAQCLCNQEVPSLAAGRLNAIHPNPAPRRAPYARSLLLQSG